MRILVRGAVPGYLSARTGVRAHCALGAADELVLHQRVAVEYGNLDLGLRPVTLELHGLIPFWKCSAICKAPTTAGGEVPWAWFMRRLSPWAERIVYCSTEIFSPVDVFVLHFATPRLITQYGSCFPNRSTSLSRSAPRTAGNRQRGRKRPQSCQCTEGWAQNIHSKACL